MRGHMLATALLAFIAAVYLDYSGQDQKPATAVSNTTCAADDHKCIASSDDYLVGDDSNKTRGNVRPPKGLTSPINLPQTQVIFSAFDKDEKPGLNITELLRALRVVSVSLNWNDGEVSHVKFDVDMDEVINETEFMALATYERSMLQRSWRMMMAYGWIFFFFLVVVQVFVLSYVEGRQFNSLGAFIKYKGLRDGKKRLWDSARAEFLGTDDYFARLKWYGMVISASLMISFIFYSLLLISIGKKPEPEDYELMLYFAGGVLAAPACAWCVLRGFDWIVEKKKRVLGKTRRSPHSVPRFQQGEDVLKVDGRAEPSGPRMCIGGNKRVGRTSRSSLAQLNRESVAEQKKANEEAKKKLQEEIKELKDQIRGAGAGEAKKKLRNQLKELELELREVLFQSGSTADQKEALGDLSGEWTPEKANRVKQQHEFATRGAGAARKNKSIGKLSELEKMDKMIQDRVQEEIASLKVEEIHDDGSTTLIE